MQFCDDAVQTNFVYCFVLKWASPCYHFVKIVVSCAISQQVCVSWFGMFLFEHLGYCYFFHHYKYICA